MSEPAPRRVRRPRQAETLAALLGAGLLTLFAVACGADDKTAPSPIPAAPTGAVTGADAAAAQESVQPDTSAAAAAQESVQPGPSATEPFQEPPTLFKLPRAGGGEVSLGALIGTQPVVVVFYRGFF